MPCRALGVCGRACVAGPPSLALSRSLFLCRPLVGARSRERLSPRGDALARRALALSIVLDFRNFPPAAVAHKFRDGAMELSGHPGPGKGECLASPRGGCTPLLAPGKEPSSKELFRGRGRAGGLRRTCKPDCTPLSAPVSPWMSSWAGAGRTRETGSSAARPIGLQQETKLEFIPSPVLLHGCLIWAWLQLTIQVSRSGMWAVTFHPVYLCDFHSRFLAPTRRESPGPLCASIFSLQWFAGSWLCPADFPLVLESL